MRIGDGFDEAGDERIPGPGRIDRGRRSRRGVVWAGPVEEERSVGAERDGDTPNAAGAKGVGAVTAASLLRRYPTLEAALDDGRFPNQADDLRLYKRIATMVRDIPMPEFASAAPDWAGAAALARKWELDGLADRLEKLAAKA